MEQLFAAATLQYRLGSFLKEQYSSGLRKNKYPVINTRKFNTFRLSLKTNRRRIAAFFFVILSYFIASRIGLYFSTDTQVSIIWPATGIGISAMMIFGFSYWPAVALGALLANVMTGGSGLVIFGVTAANVLEAVIGATVTTKLVNTVLKNKLGAHNNSFALILGNFAGAWVSASIGVFCLCISGAIDWKFFQENWITWFAGNYLGGIILVPYLLVVFLNKKIFSVREGLKFLFIFVTSIALCGFLFFSSGGAVFLFLLFPLLLLAVGVLSDRNSKFIVVFVAAMALLSTRFGSSFEIAMPFLFQIQLLLIGISTASLLVSDFKREGSLRITAVALLAGWIISTMIFYLIFSAENKKNADSFRELTTAAIKTIQNKMESNAIILRSGVGLFAASKLVEKSEWKSFVDQLYLTKSEGGLLGAGAVFRVPLTEMSSFLKKRRRDYETPLTLRNIGESSKNEAYIITYIEPEIPNKSALGLNMASEAHRKQVVDQATDSGVMAISSSVALVQDPNNALGLLLFYPIYSQGVVPTTIAERRARVVGWIYSPIRAQDFFAASMNSKDYSQISYSIKELATGITLAKSADFDMTSTKNEVVSDFSMSNNKYVFYAKPVVSQQVLKSSTSYWAGTVAILLTLLLGSFVSYIQSEKHRANELVKERTQQLENTGAIAKLGGWEYDPTTQILTWSKVTCEIFGVSALFVPDLISMGNFFKVGENRFKFLNNIKECLEHSTAWDEELVIISAGGSEVSTRIMGRIETTDTHSVRIVGTIQDITERVLLRNENSFIIDALQLGVWKLFPQTNELQWDKSMYRLYDIDPGKFDGNYEAWENMISVESKDQVVSELNDALAGKKDFVTTFKIKTRTGEFRYIGARGFVKRDEIGKPISMYGINWDRTKEHLLEEQLMFERAKTLQASKLASLGEMSAAIAHEINNPLAIIKGSAELMARIPYDADKFKSKIQIVFNSIDRISKIVNGLRKFSRSSGGYSYRNEKLVEIVKEAFNLVSLKSQRFNTSISFEFKSNPEIYCDMVEIEQVVVNLISNGIDAAKMQEANWVRVEVSEEGRFVLLKVIDSGPGIPLKNRDKLFEPFFTTKPVGEGTGLGLSITKGILDDHGATIMLDPNQQNTAFVVRFRKVEIDEA